MKTPLHNERLPFSFGVCGLMAIVGREPGDMVPAPANGRIVKACEREIIKVPAPANRALELNEHTLQWLERSSEHARQHANWLEGELNQSRAHMAELQLRLDMVYRSRSWRITKLLRATSDLFRSLGTGMVSVAKLVARGPKAVAKTMILALARMARPYPRMFAFSKRLLSPFPTLSHRISAALARQHGQPANVEPNPDEEIASCAASADSVSNSHLSSDIDWEAHPTSVRPSRHVSTNRFITRMMVGFCPPVLKKERGSFMASGVTAHARQTHHPPRILVLSTYPVKLPIHGGQHRLSNIIGAYKDAGFSVDKISVYQEESYCCPREVDETNDIPFPVTSEHRKFRGRTLPYFEDYLAGRFAVQNEDTLRRIQAIDMTGIVAIHLEQPWLLRLAKRMQNEAGVKRSLLVYSSQNIEYKLKQETLAWTGCASGQEVISEIRQLEAEAASSADLVIAVTSADKEELIEFGAKKVMVAPNGTDGLSLTSSQLDAKRHLLPRDPYVLVTGSAHPPNLEGFFECLGTSMAFLPPNRKICVVGGLCDLILHSREYNRWVAINESRIKLMGVVDQELLAAAREFSHTIMLPITSGGGSNLKTAEALYAGKYVIGTAHSFRGYEQHKTLPGVYLENDGSSFRQRLVQLLNEPPLVIEGDWRLPRTSLLWPKCLSGIPKTLKQVLDDGK